MTRHERTLTPKTQAATNHHLAMLAEQVSGLHEVAQVAMTALHPRAQMLSDAASVLLDMAGEETPHWARSSDDHDDALADPWLEATDPENERSEYAIAHYRIDQIERDMIDSLYVTLEDWRTFVGAEIHDRGSIRYLDRAAVEAAGVNCNLLDGWVDE